MDEDILLEEDVGNRGLEQDVNKNPGLNDTTLTNSHDWEERILSTNLVEVALEDVNSQWSWRLSRSQFCRSKRAISAQRLQGGCARQLKDSW